MSLEVGKIVDGKVAGITNFGAFVDIEGGKTGLVHISEVAREYVKDIREHLKVGQSVRVKVVSLEGAGKINLSIRRALLDEAKIVPKVPDDIDWFKKEDGATFEDKMLRFKQSSDEKLHDIKRGFESKRGGYRRGSGSY